MYPILFYSTALEFNDLGLGTLSDSISCEVEEERNGGYELLLEYPITGKHYSEIDLRKIILAKPNFTDEPQPFRIYKIERILEGVATVYAHHVCYDYADFCVNPHSSTGITQALENLLTNSRGQSDARFAKLILDSNLSNQTSNFNVPEPSSLRSWFGGREGSLIDVFGGEWRYDGWTASLLSSRGADRGVKILYGKNLMALDTEVNTSNVYTHMYGFWRNEEGDLVTSSVNRVSPDTSYVRFLIYDFSQQFENKPTREQLNTACTAYATANNLTLPAENITLDFVQMEKLKERVDLCDTVTVIYSALGVSATKKCIRTKWDVLRGRYSECEFGESSGNIASTIASDRSSVKKLQKDGTNFEKALSTLSGEIAEAQGFYTSSETDSAGAVTLYLHNSPLLEDSTVIAKITAETASWSTDGGTTWNTVVDAQGRALFQHLYTVGIDATYIKTGLIQGTNDRNYWNLDTGKLYISDGQVNVTTDSADRDIIALNYGNFKSSQTPNGFYTHYNKHQRTYLGPGASAAGGPGRLYLRNTNDENPSTADNIVLDMSAASGNLDYFVERVRNVDGVQTVLIAAQRSNNNKEGLVAVQDTAGTRRAYLMGNGYAYFQAQPDLTILKAVTCLSDYSLSGDAGTSGSASFTPDTGYTPIGIAGFYVTTSDGVQYARYMNVFGMQLNKSSGNYSVYYAISNTGTNSREITLTAVVMELKTSV